MPLTYLENLTVRLAQGAAELPQAMRQRHADYLRSAQQADGGFAGREGGSDLYYTGFALRGLAILGELDDKIASNSAEFLRSRLGGRESIVDFLSLIYSAKLIEAATTENVFDAAAENWPDAVAAALEELRRPDGGYAKAAEGQASSTYHSFLVLLSLQLIERPLPQPQKLKEFIYSQRCEEGGFREIRASKRAGANPTAAAIGTLQILGEIEDEIREETIDFLADMQIDEGGLRANTRIPLADVLSTFTGLLTLIDLGAAEVIDIDALTRYVRSMEVDSGGFQGFELDPSKDVEYTFYGLASLALGEHLIKGGGLQAT